MEINITPTNAKLLCEAQGLEVSPTNAKQGAAIAIHQFIVNHLEEKEREQRKPPIIEAIT